MPHDAEPVGIFGTKAPRVCNPCTYTQGIEHDSQHTFWQNVLGPPGTYIHPDIHHGISPTFREARPTDKLDHLVDDRLV